MLKVLIQGKGENTNWVSKAGFRATETGAREMGRRNRGEGVIESRGRGVKP